MTTTPLTGPAAEPLSLAEAKAHLRLTSADEDGLLSRLIIAARQHIESHTGLSLIRQQLLCTHDTWPEGESLTLSPYPVISIDALRILNEDGDPTSIPLAHTYLAATPRPARLVLRQGRRWPRLERAAGGIHVHLTAGFGPSAADVPEPLRHAAALLMAHWYEHREPVNPGEAPVPVPLSVDALLAPYRRMALL